MATVVSLRFVVGHVDEPAVVFGETLTVLTVGATCVSEAVTVRAVVEGLVVLTVVS